MYNYVYIVYVGTINIFMFSFYIMGYVLIIG